MTPAAHRPQRSHARGGLVRLAASAVAGSLVALTCLPAAHADEPVARTSTDPLELRLDRLSPSLVDADTKRAVTLAGTVTNRSNETWTAVNLAPFRSAYPITSETGLAAAAETAPTDYVGDRLTDVSSLTTLDSLAPGETARFTTTIPRSALGTSPGVYWVGVHARGETATIPRDDITDGRTRTFLPVTGDAKAARTSLVLPLRTPVRHAADGTLAEVDDWVASLSEGGELHDLLAAGRSAAPHAVSWLVDPAVIHAVAQLAAGNPGWDLSAEPGALLHGPAQAPVDPETDGDSETPTNPDEDADDSDGAESEPSQVAAAARTWLDAFVPLLTAPQADVHALPYGDVDVSALARRAPESLVRAQARGLSVLEAFGVQASPAVAPPEGTLPDSILPLLRADTLVLLSDAQVTGDGTAPLPSAGTVAGRPFVTTSSGATQGGPGPEAPGTALAVRQRVLSQSLVAGLSGDSSPLVVLPPSGWETAEGTAALTALFDSGDLRARTLSSVAESDDTVLDPNALTFTKEQRAQLLPRANVDASQDVRERADLLDAILENPADLAVQAEDAAWSDLSYAARTDPRAARNRAERAEEHLGALVAKVSISGPAVVTLSGASGRIGATVTNDLPVPVEVDVASVSGESIDLTIPNPVRVAPSSRNRLLLQADRVQQGVSQVTLKVTTLGGEEIGAEDSFPVRSSQVSGILWLVIGGGAVLLFGAIALRLFRRGLASRRDQGVS